jgi:hypothetical protein
MYRINHGGTVQRLADGAFLQEAPLNRDWQEYTKWLADGGLPEAVAPDPAVERAWRDGELIRTEWLIARHRDEVEMTNPTTLSAEQYGELLAWRQLLRDWPESAAFPDSAARPVPPAWLATAA